LIFKVLDSKLEDKRFCTENLLYTYHKTNSAIHKYNINIKDYLMDGNGKGKVYSVTFV